MGVCVVENISRVFLSEWLHSNLWALRVYIVWVKGKKVTLKNPPGKMFHDYLVGRPYPRDTRKNDSLHNSLASNHMLLTWLFRGLASREIH